MTTQNLLNNGLSGTTGTGAFVGSTSPSLTTPNIGTATGTASGNTTYTANNHGVVLSGSANAMSVLAPNSNTTYVLTSGGTGANPTWTAPITSNVNFTGGSTITSIASDGNDHEIVAISLPSAGTYLILWNVRVACNYANGQGIQTLLYSANVGSDLSFSNFMAFSNNSGSSFSIQNNVSGYYLFTATAADTISVNMRGSSGGNSFNVYADSNGAYAINYIRVA